MRMNKIAQPSIEQLIMRKKLNSNDVKFNRSLVQCACLLGIFILSVNNINAQTLSQKLPLNAELLSKTDTAPTVAYRNLNGEDLSLQSSAYTSPLTERLWRDSFALPRGSKILLSASAGQAYADGEKLINIKVELFDVQGKVITKPTRVTLEASLGAFQTISSPFQTLDSAGVLRKIEISRLEVVFSNGIAELVLRAPTTPGTALLRASSAEVIVQGEISFLPDLRSMLVVGIVEGSINLSKAKGPSSGDVKEFGFSDSLRNWEKTTSTVSSDGVEYKTIAGRVALFAKGTIKGEYLLTAAVDTDKITTQKLFRDIDPNAYYPIYGDSSSKIFDAQSSSRIYVRVDKDKSYLLYGDLKTDSSDAANKLSSYARTLTGAKAHYENNSVKLNVFAAKTANKGYVDEQPGRGISGPYALEKPNAIANTETVELLVRSRAEPAIVLSKIKLTRYSDYDFEPFSGRIVFKEPVPSVDESNNPVSIRVSYEVEEEFGDKHWVGGIDAKVKLNDSLAIGASYAKDTDAKTPYEIAGVNVEVKLGDKTYFVAELAQSKGTNAYNQSFSTITESDPLLATTGKAARLELRHEGQDLKGKIYATRSDVGFQNASAGVIAGRSELGANINYMVSPSLELNANLLQTKDESGTVTDGASRDSAGVSAAYKLNDIIKVEVGINSVKEHLINGSGGSTITTTIANNNSIPGWGFNGTGLLSTPSTLLSDTSEVPAVIDNQYTSGRLKLTASIAPNSSIYGEYEQAFGDAEKKRVAVGGEYKFSEKTRLYASHELSNTLTGVYGLNNDGIRHASTVVGLTSAISMPYLPDGQLYGELRAAGESGNRDVAAVAGIRNLWQIKPGLGLTTALERQQIYQADGIRHEATAVSLGLDYTVNPANRVTGKLEYRTSDVQEQWLGTLAYTRNLSENWSALAREAYIRSEGRGVDLSKGIQIQNQFQLGMAYRDVETGRWNALFRIENRVNKSSITADLKDEDSWILSIHGTHRLARNWTLAGQLAAKHGAQVVTNDGSYNIYSGQLASGRAIWDINDRFDASLYGSYGRDNGQRVTGWGVELGAKVIQNLWLSAGYTKGRFADVDQFSASTSWSGWHARLRYKFDENSLGVATKRVAQAVAAPLSPQPEPVMPVATVSTPAPKYEKITLEAGALFAHNQASADQILPAGRRQLDELAVKLKSLTDVDRISISGHADITNGTGDAAYNDKLSLERANSVRSYLAAQGFDSTRVQVAGLGGKQPVKTDCAVPKGAAQTAIGITRGRASQSSMDDFRACLLPNRRVEVEIFGQVLVKPEQ